MAHTGLRQAISREEVPDRVVERRVVEGEAGVEEAARDAAPAREREGRVRAHGERAELDEGLGAGGDHGRCRAVTDRPALTRAFNPGSLGISVVALAGVALASHVAGADM